MDCNCLDSRNPHFLGYVECGTVIISGSIVATCIYAAATAVTEIAVAFFGFLSFVSCIIFFASLLSIWDSSTYDAESYFANVAKNTLELFAHVVHGCLGY